MSEIVQPTRPWLQIVLWFFITEIVMVACAFLWVFIYSAFINSSGDEAYYQAYAQVASPVVAVVMAGPVFFWMGRFMCRYGDAARFAALAVVAINLVVDTALVVSMAEDLPYNVMMSVLAAAGKVLGAWFGTKPAAG